MEMPMKGFKNQPVDNAVADIPYSTDAQLRLFTVKRNSRFAPVDTVNGSWQQAAPASVREFSATAYYFGRELRQTRGVPVGLIVTAWAAVRARLDDCRLAPVLSPMRTFRRPLPTSGRSTVRPLRSTTGCCIR